MYPLDDPEAKPQRRNRSRRRRIRLPEGRQPGNGSSCQYPLLGFALVLVWRFCVCVAFNILNQKVVKSLTS